MGTLHMYQPQVHCSPCDTCYKANSGYSVAAILLPVCMDMAKQAFSESLLTALKTCCLTEVVGCHESKVKDVV